MIKRLLIAAGLVAGIFGAALGANTIYPTVNAVTDPMLFQVFGAPGNQVYATAAQIKTYVGAGGGGTVTSVICGTGLTGGTITTTGTCALDLAHANTWTAAQQFPAGTAALPSVAIGAAAMGFYQIGTNTLGISTAGALAAEITSGGQLLFSSSTSGLKTFSNNTASPQGTFADNFATSGRNSVAVASYTTSASNPATLYLGLSKSATIGNQAATVAGDQLGQINANGSDGTNFQDSAQILFKAEGTISAGVVPGEIDLLTANTAGTKTLAIKIDDAQNLTASQSVILAGSIVSALPVCGAGLTGAMRYVTDATSPTYNGTLTGGGGVVVPVFCNGSAWTSH